MLFGQYSYYVLGDPFAYVSLLFPIQWLETIYSALVIVRMYCAGLAFIFYCKYHKKDSVNTLIGTISYTFCGFILYAGIRHPYFTNAVILLPLNLIAIEKLLRENKKVFLIFIVFLTAISNYYFFYMITMVTMIYAIVKYILEYNQGIKVFFQKVFQAIGCYIVGILIASVILLPTAYAFLNSARTGYEQTWQYSPGFYQSFFQGLISMRFCNWTVVCVSAICLLMLPILFTKMKDKEVRTYAILFIMTTIMLMIPIVGSIMNGLSFPSNRWVFAYSFILSYIVTICFDRHLQYSKKQMIVMTVFLLVYTVIGMWITKLKIRTNLDFYAAILIAGMIWMIILFCNSKSKFIKDKALGWESIVAIFLVICNIGMSSFALYSEQGKGYAKEFLDNNTVHKRYDTLGGSTQYFKEAIEYIKEHDKEFYRIAKCNTSYHNASLLYDYQSIQTYVSIGNGHVYNLSCGLEDNCCMATRCVNGMDRRTKIMTLLGTKYYICSSKDNSYVPYGYLLYHEIGDTKIYKNDNFLSPGIIYNQYILKQEYEKLDPLEKEDVLLSTAVLDENTDKLIQNRSVSEQLEKINKIQYTEKGNKIQGNQIEITKKNESITLELSELKENTEVYFSIQNLRYDSGNEKTNFKITTSFQGRKDSEKVEDCLSSAYYVKNPNFLMNLGVIRKNIDNKLKITFSHKGTYTFDKLEVLEVPMESYENKAQSLKKNEMKNVTYGNDFISGSIDNKKDGILQITTSYSDGWKAFVDGKEAEVIKVNEGFIGTFVEAGKHEVRFEYKTPYITISLILSSIGIISLGIIYLFEKKKQI